MTKEHKHRLQRIFVAGIFGMTFFGAKSQASVRIRRYCSTKLEKMQQEANRFIVEGKIDKPFLVLNPEKLSKVNSEAFGVQGLLFGEYGGHRLIIQRKKSWHDATEDLDLNAGVTQDLRIPFLTLDVDGAKFFGFQQISDTEMIVPTVDELNSAIDAFNKGLKEEDPRFIKIKFYASDKVRVEGPAYVRHFAKNLELPISIQGRQFTHDISTHSLEGFFLNNEIIDILRNRILIWLDFCDSMRRGTTYGRNKDFIAWNKRVLDSFSEQIDQLGMSAGSYIGKEFPLFMSNTLKDPSGSMDIVVQGLDEVKLPAVIEVPSVFFTSRLFVQGVPKAFVDYFRTHIIYQQAQYPSRFDRLSFNMGYENLILDRVNRQRKDYTPEKRRAVFGLLRVSAPYIDRLERLNKLTHPLAASPKK